MCEAPPLTARYDQNNVSCRKNNWPSIKHLLHLLTTSYLDLKTWSSSPESTFEMTKGGDIRELLP